MDGQPMLIDVGVGVYRRQTFGMERFEIWTMQSSWHNAPSSSRMPGTSIIPPNGPWCT
jgi:hypothetical protein